MNNTKVFEYIWIDAYNKLRSKTKVITEYKTSIALCKNNLNTLLDALPNWNFDGSSTGQAIGSDSEVILKPQCIVNDPFRENGFLVLCDLYDNDDKPIKTNNRHRANEIFNKKLKLKPLYGLEQEYVLIEKNTGKLAGWPSDPNLKIRPQGTYYCGVGCGNVVVRNVVEEHLQACITAGLKISGINAEVMLAQWEFQIGPALGIEAGDHLWLARYILERICEKYDLIVSYDPKPVIGDWNGSGCHANYSTNEMRADGGIDKIYEGIKKLEQKHDLHMECYGTNDKRMTGLHETSAIDNFSYGVGDRTASIRIPNDTFKQGKGYLEDRRPASDIDPYVVTSIMFETMHL